MMNMEIILAQQIPLWKVFRSVPNFDGVKIVDGGDAEFVIGWKFTLLKMACRSSTQNYEPVCFSHH